MKRVLFVSVFIIMGFIGGLSELCTADFSMRFGAGGLFVGSNRQICPVTSKENPTQRDPKAPFTTSGL
jgi:hypothetical protein